MGLIDQRTRRAALAALDTLPESSRPEGVRIARFVGLDADGRFLVDVSDTGEAIVALSTVALAAADAGVSVVVAFEEGDTARPVILGRAQRQMPVTVQRDASSERVVIQADREIELRCGEASIILTRAGKVLIRGSYVLSRSRGANRIKGAVVDIN